MKVGDWVWTVQNGWVRVKEINRDASANFALKCGWNWYTREGLLSAFDKYPSLFLTPPADFDAEPKPCEFQEGDRVLVWERHSTTYARRYFARYDETIDQYKTWIDGGDKWSSEGQTVGWDCCKKWEGE